MTWLPRKAAAQMEEALKKSADARKHAIALSSLEYSGDLSQKLLAFSKKMETTFKYIQDLRSKKVEDPKQFGKYFSIVDDQIAWFTKAEAWNCISVGVLALLKLEYLTTTLVLFSMIWTLSWTFLNNLNTMLNKSLAFAFVRQQPKLCWMDWTRGQKRRQGKERKMVRKTVMVRKMVRWKKPLEAESFFEPVVFL